MNEDIDFKNNTIHIHRSVQKTKKEGIKIKKTKTGEEKNCYIGRSYYGKSDKI